MKNKHKFDEYGFSEPSITFKRFKRVRLHIYISFASQTGENALFVAKYNSRGLIGDLLAFKKFKEKLADKNIVEIFAFCIKHKYEYRDYFNYNFYGFVKSLPESILFNNNAVQEILSMLPKHNKELYIEVGNTIREYRKSIEKKKRIAHNTEQSLTRQKEEIDKEFGI